MNWDLSILYKDFSDPAFQKDMALIPQATEKLTALVESGLPPKELLEQAVDLTEGVSAVTERLSSFTALTLAVDAHNGPAAQAMDQLMNLSIGMQVAFSALTRYVGSVEALDAIIASSEKLSGCGFALLEMKEHAAHLLPKDLESWMLRMSLSGGEAFSQLRDKLDATHTVDFRGESLPLSAIRAKAYDPDPLVRKEAYRRELASYDKLALPMSYCLNSIKAQGETMAQARGYADVLDWMLDLSRMDRETLDAMWEAVREALPHFRRYLRAKGKLLGHEDGLPFYDLFAPCGKGLHPYTPEEARQKLIHEMGKFDPEMGAFIHTAFADHWIDLFPREGKGGGAFCSGIHSLDVSRVMTNFAGSFSDVSTLAHELGHAWHNRCMKGLPYLMIDTPMPLAETASIFNETMLSHQVLKEASPQEAFSLLEAGLMEDTQTVVDIYSRFLFESEVIEKRRDHTLSVEELNEAMLRAQEASYGDGLQKDARHPFMWACKVHYYNPGLHFYNFPYCFGMLFGKGVFAQYLESKNGFAERYKKLLRSCGSGKVRDIALSVGIDVHSVAFWRGSLRTVVENIDRFVALCAGQA